MITYSGVHIQKVGGVEGIPTSMDIAVHAGRICRFGGAVWEPLLTHLVFVGILAFKRSRKLENLIAGFLHDGHETVTNDVPRPFKCDCMKQEQVAIDKRLFPLYFTPDMASLIDWDLIKLCDFDACDIEAVELALPEYSAITKKHATGYLNREHIHAETEDQELFRKIMAADFYQNTIFGESSPGVKRFAKALELARLKMHDGLVLEILNWGLL